MSQPAEATNLTEELIFPSELDSMRYPNVKLNKGILEFVDVLKVSGLTEWWHFLCITVVIDLQKAIDWNRSQNTRSSY